MLESANRYAVTSREFIRRAQQYLAVEDLHQASEKGWGAAAEMVKAVAESEAGRMTATGSCIALLATWHESREMSKYLAFSR